MQLHFYVFVRSGRLTDVVTDFVKIRMGYIVSNVTIKKNHKARSFGARCWQEVSAKSFGRKFWQRVCVCVYVWLLLRDADSKETTGRQRETKRTSPKCTTQYEAVK